jgi:RNAse (barnase) inhibitor barstar
MIEELLSGRTEPGMHTWHADRREAARGVTEAERAGWRVFWLDASGVRDKAALLERCQEEFALPSYFGHNWDALEDSLKDLSWAPATRGYLVVYDHWQDLAETEIHHTLVDVFASAVAYWRGTPTPMAVILLDSEVVA